MRSRSTSTCLAFAASDSHAGVRAGWDPLSCEFALYNAQRRAGRSVAQGAVLGAMLDALRIDGQSIEAGWPCLDAAPTDPSAWMPPSEVGKRFARVGVAGGGDLGSVRSNLAAGRPMIALTSRSFFMPVEGVVDAMPVELPEPSQRHALVAVGSGRVFGMPAVLVRNSWGPAWGLIGHAWLTDRFLGPRLFATAALLEEVDVSSRQAAA